MHVDVFLNYSSHRITVSKAPCPDVPWLTDTQTPNSRYILVNLWNRVLASKAWCPISSILDRCSIFIVPCCGQQSLISPFHWGLPNPLVERSSQWPRPESRDLSRKIAIPFCPRSFLNAMLTCAAAMFLCKYLLVKGPMYAKRRTSALHPPSDYTDVFCSDAEAYHSDIVPDLRLCKPLCPGWRADNS